MIDYTVPQTANYLSDIDISQADLPDSHLSPLLLQGDCLAVLPNLPSGSVDLIVTSPPYSDQRKSTYGGVHPDLYVKWFMPIASELYRVLKDDGSFILNIKERVVAGERHTYVIELVLAMKKMGWLRTEDYIWYKKNSAPGKWPNRFRDAWEHLYHFTKSRHFTMNQEAVMVPIGDWSKSRLKNLSSVDKARQESATGSGIGRNMSNWIGRDMVYPDNVLYISGECSNRSHSAAFPVALPLWFIRCFSNPGDLVLDPFVGSGTTAVAAFREQRRAIGIELSANYLQIAQARLDEEFEKESVPKQPFLPGIAHTDGTWPIVGRPLDPMLEPTPPLELELIK
ncbi:MAG: DNA-methyltransferase [Acidobacteriaceae bacterium]